MLLQWTMGIVGAGRRDCQRAVHPRQKLGFQVMIGLFQRRHSSHTHALHQPILIKNPRSTLPFACGLYAGIQVIPNSCNARPICVGGNSTWSFPARLWSCFVIGPDRFRHALKTHTGRPAFFAGAESSGEEGIVANSPLTNEEITRLTSRSCGELPGIGRTLPSRHFRRLMVATIPRVWLRTVVPPARPSAPSSNRNSGSTCFSAPADEALSSAMVWQALPWAAARISPPADTVR